jgi:hypothetical protein
VSVLVRWLGGYFTIFSFAFSVCKNYKCAYPCVGFNKKIFSILVLYKTNRVVTWIALFVFTKK